MTTLRDAAENATAWVPVVPVVRGLVWEVGPYTLNAQGYRIEYGEGGRLYVRSSEASGMFGTIEFADSVDAAKAAAQADYEQRILSTLNPDFLSALDTARAEIERLRAALKPFAEAGDIFEARAEAPPQSDDDPVHSWTHHKVGTRTITVGDFRCARATLSPAVKEPK